jgi:hypothetical protein
VRNLLRCRRGSAAFATVIALVPLIGVLALGAEAGSWYVTKQGAQNAADSAAMSAAFNYVNGDAQPDFGNLNGFPSDVTISQGSYSIGGTNYVAFTALVTKCQPQTGLSLVLYTGSCTPTGAGASIRKTVEIRAEAVAIVRNDVKQLCGLGLGRYSGSGSPTSALEFQGSETMTGNGCGFQSDNTVKFASTPSFSGTNWAVYASAGCINSGNCNPGVPFNYFMLPAHDPLATLDTASFNSATTKNPAKQCKSSPCTIPANSPTTAYGDLTVTNGNVVTFTSGGTYFFYNAAIKITGGTVTGTNVNIVLLGSSSLSISGGNVQLSANFSNTTYPALNGVLFDDQAPNAANNQVKINGGAGVTIALGGSMYFPNVDVTMSGNSKNTNTNCTEVIGNSIDFGGGTSYLSTQGCASGTVPTSQIVQLVQ